MKKVIKPLFRIIWLIVSLIISTIYLIFVSILYLFWEFSFKNYYKDVIYCEFDGCDILIVLGFSPYYRRNHEYSGQHKFKSLYHWIFGLQ